MLRPLHTTALSRGSQGRPSLVRPLSVERVRLRASSTRYQGAYGPYEINAEDEREVFLYRLGINVAAAAAVSSSLTVALPSEVQTALQPALNPIAIAGIAGLGLSLTQIHIYVDPLKKALQVLWALGTVGTLAIMLTQDTPAAAYVVEHPVATWFVGPVFAALTGVAFKEGLCYGKLEAAGLFGTTPLLLLGHLFHVLPEDGEKGMLAIFCALLTVFALRKWTQPVKDDVGDKSVFAMLKLSPEEQDAMRQMRQDQEQR